jgi:hypothetical protein
VPEHERRRGGIVELEVYQRESVRSVELEDASSLAALADLVRRWCGVDREERTLR